MIKIKKDEFCKDTFYVAENIILGSYLFTNNNGIITGGIITEIEVYIGAIDKAAHSYKCKRTKRTEIQFNQGGCAYTFLIYGLHTQFCIVTNKENICDVVLIRSIEPTHGIDEMKIRRNTEDINKLTVGPGNLCKALGITKDFYGKSLESEQLYLCWNNNFLYGDKNIIETSRRIGIDYAEEFVDVPWRYYIKNNKFVSKLNKTKK